MDHPLAVETWMNATEHMWVVIQDGRLKLNQCGNIIFFLTKPGSTYEHIISLHVHFICFIYQDNFTRFYCFFGISWFFKKKATTKNNHIFWFKKILFLDLVLTKKRGCLPKPTNPMGWSWWALRPKDEAVTLFRYQARLVGGILLDVFRAKKWGGREWWNCP